MRCFIVESFLVTSYYTRSFVNTARVEFLYVASTFSNQIKFFVILSNKISYLRVLFSYLVQYLPEMEGVYTAVVPAKFALIIIL